MSIPPNSQPPAYETPSSRGRAAQIIPLLAVTIIIAFAAANTVRGRNNQYFDGMIVWDFPVYTFYPDQQGCHPTGTAYFLIPNATFDQIVAPPTADPEHLNRLLHATWKAKLRGNLSPLGRFGGRNKRWRELDVLEAVDAVQLECHDEQIGATE